MADAIDLENKERLLDEIYKVVKLSLPDDLRISPETEIRIDLFEKMLDNALGTNSSGKKRFYDYGLNLSD
jgi:hypothetical protein